ncbi:MAG: serine protease [Bacteroidales bacterium]|jgi:V8-like Glu-specific endopeptidase|nr:serine protease [Bacteroidales bacterium]
MIQHIITAIDKRESQNKIRRIVRNYYIIYWAVLALLICIVILPFHLHLVPTANTEPKEAVVKIGTEESMGTGFLISPNYILTARHVVEDLQIGQTVNIVFDQAKVSFETTATIVYYKENVQNDDLAYLESDVAILQLENEVTQISPLELGNSDEFETGKIVVMGYGLDDWSEPDGKITSASYHEIKTLYKLDASVNLGHSGGPVLMYDEQNKVGKVVGIVIADFSTILTMYTGILIKGESVVLKINQAEKILSQGGFQIREFNY